MISFFWNEEWKELEFEKGALKKRYALSNYGRVISFTDKLQEGNLIKGGLLGGYPTLPMRPFGKSTTFYIHKLVAEFFLNPPAEDQTFVLHVDFNKKNNYFGNLKWATKEEVVEHQQKNPLVREAREKQKERYALQGQKLTATQVMRLKMKINDPNRKTRLKMLAKQFGISEMQLYRIKLGENWGHVKVENEN
ncbi:MAG: NUMOD4 domain-containing protein [Breznakibacter sp.]